MCSSEKSINLFDIELHQTMPHSLRIPDPDLPFSKFSRWYCLKCITTITNKIVVAWKAPIWGGPALPLLGGTCGGACCRHSLPLFLPHLAAARVDGTTCVYWRGWQWQGHLPPRSHWLTTAVTNTLGSLAVVASRPPIIGNPPPLYESWNAPPSRSRTMVMISLMVSGEARKAR
jgi:hypothetical protein